jgi:competence protein ComEC
VKRLFRFQFRRITLQLLLLLGFLLGIGLARRRYEISIVLIASLAVISCYGFYKRTLHFAVFIMVFGLSLGCWRGAIFMRKLDAYTPYYGQVLTLHMRAVQDGVYGSRSQMSFDGQDIRLSGGTKLAGKVAVSGFGSNAIFQGDEVAIIGKLRPGYGAKQATLSFAKITVSKHHNSVVAEIRRKFAAGMQTALPEPLGSFAMGLLIGQRATLPASVKQDLLMVGLTHIIAVSGYNLTIMLHASKKLFAKQSKRLTTGSSLLLIMVFLLLAGSSASIVRAAIVSTISIATSYYGRSINPLNLISLAAVITAYANPFYVWSDISWYLSFLAFFGVMVLAPLVSERLTFMRKKSVIVSVGIESISAEIMSLPIVLFTFGQMSLIGLPANMLVVALVPLAMLLSTIAGLAGMLAPQFAGWIAWPAKQLLSYMLDISHVLAGLPHIFAQNLALPLAQMLLWYAGIATMTYALWYKSKTRSVIITDITDEK